MRLVIAGVSGINAPSSYQKDCIKNLAIVPNWDYTAFIRIVSISTLKAFWEQKPAYLDAKSQLEAWASWVRKADWSSPMDVKGDLRNTSILQDGRVIFNIAGNKYRLVVKINYRRQIVYIRFVGTHKQYDAIDAQHV